MATALIDGNLRARLRKLEERRRRRRGYLPLTPIFDGDDERAASATDAERAMPPAERGFLLDEDFIG